MLRKRLASWATKCLRRLPPETAHQLAIAGLRWCEALLPTAPSIPKELSCKILGRQLAHPVGLAAGFDKNAVAISGLARLGFSVIEVGSVTLRPQPGNPKPRVHRLPDCHAVINSYGFNSRGAAYVEQQLRRNSSDVWLGINVGRTQHAADAAAEFAACAERLVPYAGYLVINVSSPNTVGLRDLQAPDRLVPLIRKVRHAARQGAASVPLFVKLAPDMDLRTETATVEAALEQGVEGLIISNTTLSRPELPNYLAVPGGLSGAPLAPLAGAMLRRVAHRTRGRMALIASGGIADGADAFERLSCGADMIQIYTALVLRGPDVVGRILEDLAGLMVRNGVRSVHELRPHSACE